MLSTIQIAFALCFFIGLGGWWVARSLNRDNLEKQIEQTLDALNGASDYWAAKLADPTVSAYAHGYLLSLDVERGEVLQMQTALAVGERLTVKQLVRLDKLVSEHLAQSSALMATGPMAHNGR